MHVSAAYKNCIDCSIHTLHADCNVFAHRNMVLCISAAFSMHSRSDKIDRLLMLNARTSHTHTHLMPRPYKCSEQNTCILGWVEKKKCCEILLLIQPLVGDLNLKNTPKFEGFFQKIPISKFLGQPETEIFINFLILKNSKILN